MIRFRLILIGALLCCFSITAQTKNEKEFRISLSEFPQNSQEILSAVQDQVKRIRFYKEIDGDQESYESKFKFGKRWFSVEFSKDGVLEDIEVTVKEKQIENMCGIVWAS